MPRGGFWNGMTKEQTRSYFSAELAKKPSNEFFEFAELSELFLQHHWRCKLHADAPSAFMKDVNAAIGRGFRGYTLRGRFTCGATQKLSYIECIYPKTTRYYVVHYLRTLTGWHAHDYKNRNPMCAECGQMAEDVDHVAPQFNDLATKAYQLFSESHWEWHVTKYRKELSRDINSDIEFSLPEDHPAARYIQYVHDKKMVELQSLCKDCHKKVTSMRQQQDKAA